MVYILVPAMSRRLEVVAAAALAPPFTPEALVAEEDTFLVLSAPPEVREPDVPSVRVFHDAFTARPLEPGSVIVRGGAPVRLLAVVHDLSEQPTWREEWVAAALEGVLHEAAVQGVRTLAMPLLGRVHGDLPRETFVALLRAALGSRRPGRLERLWLITPEGDLDQMRALLASDLLP